MSKISKLRSFRLRPNTLLALQAAAAEHEVSPNRLCEALLRDGLTAWLQERVQGDAAPSQKPFA